MYLILFLGQPFLTKYAIVQGIISSLEFRKLAFPVHEHFFMFVLQQFNEKLMLRSDAHFYDVKMFD